MTEAAGSDRLVDIRILGVPVALYQQASQHHEELRREFALIATSAGPGSSPLPARLSDLVEDLNRRFRGLTAEPRLQLDAAIAAGEDTIDLVYRVPVQAGPAAAEFDALLDEADAYCREGTTLLTLATSDRAAAFRRWFLSEFVRQAAGQAPQRWVEPED